MSENVKNPGEPRMGTDIPVKNTSGSVKVTGSTRHSMRGLGGRPAGPSGGRSSPTHPSCTKARPAGSPGPPWPRPARSRTNWRPPWPAARPAAPARRWKPKSRRSPANPGPAGSSPGSYPAASPKTCALPGTSTPAARAALEEELSGKHVLITSHDDRPVAEVIAGYRSQSEAESGFRQLKDPRVVSFSPMFHWTEHNIRVHTFTCVLALQIAHLMRRQAGHAGLHLSVRQLLGQLAAVGETVLIYPSAGGRPKARRKTTELTAGQQKLYQIFDLSSWHPRVRSYAQEDPRTPTDQQERLANLKIIGNSG